MIYIYISYLIKKCRSQAFERRLTCVAIFLRVPTNVRGVLRQNKISFKKLPNKKTSFVFYRVIETRGERAGNEKWRFYRISSFLYRSASDSLNSIGKREKCCLFPLLNSLLNTKKGKCIDFNFIYSNILCSFHFLLS